MCIGYYKKGAANTVAVAVFAFLAVVSMGVFYGYYCYAQKLISEKKQFDRLEEKAKRELDSCNLEVDSWVKLVGEDRSKVATRIEGLTAPDNNLRGLLDEKILKLQSVEASVEIASFALQEANIDKESAAKRTQRLESVKNTELSSARGKLSNIQNLARAIESKKKSEISKVSGEISVKNSKYQKDREAFEEDRRKSLSERKTILEKSRQLVIKIRMAKGIHPDIDGHIIKPDLVKDFVTIDVGKRDGLKMGLVFRVYRFTRTGQRLDKGRIRIRNVFDNYALAAIIDYDKTMPMVPGDFIESVFFPLGSKFIVAGIFDNIKTVYSKEEIIEHIKNYKGDVQEQVDLDTAYSVEGERDMEDPELVELFSLLRQFRVKKLTPDDFALYLPDKIRKK